MKAASKLSPANPKVELPRGRGIRTLPIVHKQVLDLVAEIPKPGLNILASQNGENARLEVDPFLFRLVGDLEIILCDIRSGLQQKHFQTTLCKLFRGKTSRGAGADYKCIELLAGHRFLPGCNFMHQLTLL